MLLDTRLPAEATWGDPGCLAGRARDAPASRADARSHLHRSSTEHRPLAEAAGLEHALRSSPAILASSMRRTPQALPVRLAGFSGCESLRDARVSSIKSSVSVATFSPLGRDASPAFLRVGDWTFHGSMTTIYDGSAGLSNSCVQMGRAVSVNSAGSRSDMLVAVKTVALDSDEDSVKMIRREQAVLADLGDSHPHILPMLCFTETSTDLVLLTRFASAGDLASYMPRNSPVAEGEVRKLARQLLSALSFLHGRRIVHGDIKPPNVFLTEFDEAGMLAQVSDFGLSARVPDGQSVVRVDGVQGSYGFVPAEVIDRGELGFAADLFALGVMAFRYLGGHDPFFPPSRVHDP
ncbi:unnamed protein product [Prorocentrum cordatum]|uniref:Protein kinase domain-containing protein n=2 Tax=Prorocentrum cordatum TaxID=2364126 RepID=A0ABN9UNN5_9DINO|nr:unnamed protein product [Polarella glacialis]CAK0861541.1 unnamed protein product [Polarella glacialis]